MAPRPRILVRKVKQSTAMKTAMRASLEDISSAARLTQAAFSPSIFSMAESVAEGLSSLKEDFFHALGMIARLAMEEPVEGDAVIFHDFCVAGLVPPFSKFFLAVLETYGLHMLHLHPQCHVDIVFFCLCLRGVCWGDAIDRAFPPLLCSPYGQIQMGLEVHDLQAAARSEDPVS